MHPAKSVIYLTVSSGAGYGLVVWTAGFAAFGSPIPYWGLGIALFGTALFLIISGLTASTLHLGHSGRAWRGLTQWRSSWLSREAALAIITFVPLGIFAWGWVMIGSYAGPWMVTGLIAAALSLATVYATGQIYASLKAIPAWHHPLVVPLYLVLSVMSGGILFLPISMLWLLKAEQPATIVTLVLIALGLVLKLIYWRDLARGEATETASSATGLKGKVTMLDSPHDEKNYLMKEMGYEVARKHAAKLRFIAIAFAFVLPFASILTATFFETDMEFGFLTIAVFFALIGLFAERSLFFAEARHAVTLYYGKEKV